MPTPPRIAGLRRRAEAGWGVTLRATRHDDDLWPLAVAALILVPSAWPADHVLLLRVALLALRAANRSVGTLRTHLSLTVLVMTALPWILFLLGAPRATQALEAIVRILPALLLV